MIVQNRHMCLFIMSFSRNQKEDARNQTRLLIKILIRQELMQPLIVDNHTVLSMLAYHSFMSMTFCPDTCVLPVCCLVHRITMFSFPQCGAHAHVAFTFGSSIFFKFKNHNFKISKVDIWKFQKSQKLQILKAGPRFLENREYNF